jgi:hypothetical protein
MPNPLTISTLDKLKVDARDGQVCQPFFDWPIIMSKLSLELELIVDMQVASTLVAKWSMIGRVVEG